MTKERSSFALGAMPFGWRSRAGAEILQPDAHYASLGRKAKSYANLEPIPEEQRVIRRARELRQQGKTYRDIAAVLQNEGLNSRSGNGFSATQIKRMTLMQSFGENFIPARTRV